MIIYRKRKRKPARRKGRSGQKPSRLRRSLCFGKASETLVQHLRGGENRFIPKGALSDERSEEFSPLRDVRSGFLPLLDAAQSRSVFPKQRERRNRDGFCPLRPFLLASSPASSPLPLPSHLSKMKLPRRISEEPDIFRTIQEAKPNAKYR